MPSQKFTAESARNLALRLDESTLNKVIESIKSEALKGERRVFVYEGLPLSVLEELIKRGFKVEHSPRIQDGYYYKITW